jgi:hypothetical protein
MEIIIPGKLNGISATGETRKLMEPYNFEMVALKKFYGQHYKDRFKRTLIAEAYAKHRPADKIERMAAIGDSKGVPEYTMVSLIYKWLMKNEYLFNLKFTSIQGRHDEMDDDAAKGIDTRDTVIYGPDFVDKWMDEKKDR